MDSEAATFVACVYGVLGTGLVVAGLADAYDRGRAAGRAEAQEEARRAALFALRNVTEQADGQVEDARAVASGAWRMARLLAGRIQEVETPGAAGTVSHGAAAPALHAEK